MPTWLEKLPWSVKTAGGALGSLMSAAATRFSDTLEPYFWGLAVVLAVFVVAGTIWHLVNEARVRRRQTKLIFEPSYIVALGLILAGIGIFLQAARPTTKVSELETKINRINKYVMPRELSDDQINTITRYLLERPPSEKIQLIYDPSDSEAIHYMGRFLTALRSGNWEPDPRGIDLRKMSPLREGVQFFVRRPPNDQSNPRALRVLGEALRAANVPSGGMTSTTDQEVSETVVQFLVGPKPRRIDEE